MLAGGLLLTLFSAGCGVRPSEVITGRPAMSGPSVGVELYLVSRGQLTLVVRPANRVPSPEETLGMLAAGPDEFERVAGLTSEVPAALAPMGLAVRATPAAGGSGFTVMATPDGSGLTVTTVAAVRPLSALAADQIICTVAGAVARTGQGDSFAPVTIVGPDGARPARSCPIG
ncbi:hypothetical protein DKT68_16555 [Micromonospora acroterricola]|uniref:GerMN domain-containing protein n=1 Tax=Micromonospora acroterricola TaxID=2202421 RepID=A0A317D6J7_9ACTN|nr:hypothetical protein DKT68_16555 [Micromonospora acroterricola]